MARVHRGDWSSCPVMAAWARHGLCRKCSATRRRRDCAAPWVAPTRSKRRFPTRPLPTHSPRCSPPSTRPSSRASRAAVRRFCPRSHPVCSCAATSPHRKRWTTHPPPNSGCACMPACWPVSRRWAIDSHCSSYSRISSGQITPPLNCSTMSDDRYTRCRSCWWQAGTKPMCPCPMRCVPRSDHCARNSRCWS